MLAFVVGALLPLLTITLVDPDARVPVTVGLGRRGAGPHRVDERQALLRAAGRAVLRNVAGGLLAMAVTYAIGSLVGTRV